MEGHDGNIFVRDSRPVFIDWAEAVVTHPFVGPLQNLFAGQRSVWVEPGSPEVERLRDLYLEPFSRFAPMTELRSCSPTGTCSTESPAPSLATHARSAAGRRAGRIRSTVAAWLEIIRELVDGTTTPGGA